MNEINVGILEAEQWEIFKHLQIAALKEDPTVFSKLLEDEEKEQDETWKKRLQNHGNNEWYYFAESGGEVIGMISAKRSDSKKSSHVAEVTCIYAAKDKQTVIRMLLGKLLSSLTQDGIPKVRILVNTKLTKEIKEYQEYGFNIKGTLEKEYLINGVYFDLNIMEKLSL